MKSRRYIILFSLSFLIIGFSCTICRADIFDDIAIAIKSGNSKEVARYFSERVEMKAGDNEDIYSKTQAEIILKDFFDKNTPVNFVIKHKGASQKGLSYVIGLFQTSNGSYRTMIRFKQVGNQMLIQELRFEKE
jgi:hypothetical protein